MFFWPPSHFTRQPCRHGNGRARARALPPRGEGSGGGGTGGYWPGTSLHPPSLRPAAKESARCAFRDLDYAPLPHYPAPLSRCQQINPDHLERGPIFLIIVSPAGCREMTIQPQPRLLIRTVYNASFFPRFPSHPHSPHPCLLLPVTYFKLSTACIAGHAHIIFLVSRQEEGEEKGRVAAIRDFFSPTPAHVEERGASTPKSRSPKRRRTKHSLPLRA